MATRFGATPAQDYNNRLKLLLGFLLLLLALLAIVFFAMSQNSPQPVPLTSVATVAPAVQLDPGTEVLVAQSRIEEGTLLDSFMFTTLRIEESKIPLGAIRQKDLQAAVLGKFAARLISPNIPLLTADISSSPPLEQVPIPAGYRLVSLSLGDEQASGGFVKPNSRVDVTWRYVENNQTNLSSLVCYVKVAAVNGMTTPEAQVKAGPKNYSLIVLEEDAKRIELARSLGSLGLMLVGEREDIASAKCNNEPIGRNGLVRGGITQAEQPTKLPDKGKAMIKDPKSGKIISYYLDGQSNSWQLDPASGK